MRAGVPALPPLPPLSLSIRRLATTYTYMQAFLCLHAPACARPHTCTLQVGDTLSVTLSRRIRASDDFDVQPAWPLTGTRWAIWAMGPLSETSTAANPVVLYHSLQVGAEGQGYCCGCCMMMMVKAWHCWLRNVCPHPSSH
jgi:hypothetical protein